MRHDKNKVKFIYKPQAIIQDKRLTALEQDYLCLIAQLQKAGGCTASNNYFADYFKVERTTAVQTIGNLRQKKFIDGIEKKSGGKTVQRTLFILDDVSRKHLLRDSRQALPINSGGIVGNTGVDSGQSLPSDSRQRCNHTIDIQQSNNNTSFDVLWDLYPRKVSKPQALKAFCRLNPDPALFDKILGAVNRQKLTDQWQKDGGRFIPHLSTWLNNRRWEDEIEVKTAIVAPFDEEAARQREAMLQGGL